jgi:hypothetical protein
MSYCRTAQTASYLNQDGLSPVAAARLKGVWHEFSSASEAVLFAAKEAA